MRPALVMLLLSGCVTSRFVAHEADFEAKAAKQEALIIAQKDLPPGARPLGRLEVFHNNLTAPEPIVNEALRRARDVGCAWLVHLNPRGNAAVKTEGVEVVLTTGQGPGPAQAEGENRADFWCFAR